MEKRKYTSPVIEKIILDNEIALVLASTPPAGPDEVNAVIPLNFNNNPFEDNHLG